MNNEHMELIKKGCRDLYHARKRIGVKETETLTVEEEIIFNQIIEQHVNSIRDLRRRSIVCRCLGVAGYEKETRKAVGESMGITGSRVGQLERKALIVLFRSICPQWRSWIWE
jgi:DNA-directed RNA polymerase specialized sigma subunit